MSDVRNKTVSNRFYVTALEDGSTLSAVLYCDQSLTQMYNKDTSTCIPDWEADTSKRPLIYSSIRRDGVNVALQSYDWSYDNEVLTFGNDGKSTNVNYPGWFEKTTYSWGAVSAPALRILKNLAGADADNHSILLSGSVTVGNGRLDFSCSIPFRVSQLSGSGFAGTITGNSVVTNGTAPSDTSFDESKNNGFYSYMQAHLYSGASESELANNTYYTKWYRVGVDPDNTPYATTPLSGRTDHKIRIGADDVDDYVVLKVNFYNKSNEFLCTVLWDVDDMQDEEEMVIIHDSESGNDASLRKGQSAVFKAWMGKRTNPNEIDARYTTFKCQLYDSDSNVITTGLPGGATPDADGFYDITQTSGSPKTGISPARWGQTTITYDFAKLHGDKISGIVVATSETV